jgi:hypothetical protein
MELKKFILYIIEWLTPSCTAAYIILTDKISWGTYIIWGYPVNIPSYIIASLAGAAVFYYLNKYIFKSSGELFGITINGIPITVYPQDEITIYNRTIKGDTMTITKVEHIAWERKKYGN